MKRLIYIIFLLCFCACKEEILHDITELQANRAKLLLSESAIAATKLRTGSSWTIAVEKKQANLALKKLEDSRFVKSDIGSSSSSQGLIQSREEKRFFLERKVATSIETTLQSLPGVLEARVHLFMPLNNNYTLKQKKAFESASVLLATSGEDGLNEKEIRQIVSGASGVEKEAINVVLKKQEQKRTTSDILKTAHSGSKQAHTANFFSNLALTNFHILVIGAILVGALSLYFLLFRKKAKIQGEEENKTNFPLTEEDKKLSDMAQAFSLEPKFNKRYEEVLEKQ